jgi:hypothetical protein
MPSLSQIVMKCHVTGNQHGTCLISIVQLELGVNKQHIPYNIYNNDSRSRSRTIINGFIIITTGPDISKEITYKEKND